MASVQSEEQPSQPPTDTPAPSSMTQPTSVSDDEPTAAASATTPQADEKEEEKEESSPAGSEPSTITSNTNAPAPPVYVPSPAKPPPPSTYARPGPSKYPNPDIIEETSSDGRPAVPPKDIGGSPETKAKIQGYLLQNPKLSQLFDRLPSIIENAGHNEMWGVELRDPFHPPTVNILIKYLRANDGNVSLAEEQLTKSLQWRKEMEPLKLAEKCEFRASKFKGLGYVTTYRRSATWPLVFTWNIYGSAKDNIDETFGDVEEFIKWRVALMELAIRDLRLGKATTVIDYNGEDPYQMIQVHDYLNVSFLRMSPTVKQASRRTIETFSMAYPELLREKFFVNVPAIMQWVFGAIKVFLSKNTVRKFRPISNGANLAREFSNWANHIPRSYGGLGPELYQHARTVPLLDDLPKPPTPIELATTTSLPDADKPPGDIFYTDNAVQTSELEGDDANALDQSETFKGTHGIKGTQDVFMSGAADDEVEKMTQPAEEDDDDDDDDDAKSPEGTDVSKTADNVKTQKEDKSKTSKTTEDAKAPEDTKHPETKAETSPDITVAEDATASEEAVETSQEIEDAKAPQKGAETLQFNAEDAGASDADDEISEPAIEHETIPEEKAEPSTTSEEANASDQDAETSLATENNVKAPQEEVKSSESAIEETKAPDEPLDKSDVVAEITKLPERRMTMSRATQTLDEDSEIFKLIREAIPREAEADTDEEAEQDGKNGGETVERSKIITDDAKASDKVEIPKIVAEDVNPSANEVTTSQPRSEDSVETTATVAAEDVKPAQNGLKTSESAPGDSKSPEVKEVSKALVQDPKDPKHEPKTSKATVEPVAQEQPSEEVKVSKAIENTGSPEGVNIPDIAAKAASTTEDAEAPKEGEPSEATGHSEPQEKNAPAATETPLSPEPTLSESREIASLKPAGVHAAETK